MIIYNPRRCAGYIVLTSCKGSSFVSAMPLPILAALFTLLIKLLPDVFSVPATAAGDEKDGAEALITHPQASYALTSIVGFLLLFRSNLAYSRFWEGRTAVQNMGAAWAEVGSLVVAFDSASKGRDDYGEWKADFVHLLSLFHALAVMSLRTDADLSNIVPHTPYQDFDGTTYTSADPWMHDDAATDDDDILSGAGSTASMTSRRSSADTEDSSTSVTSLSGSPHRRLRRRSSSRTHLPARPAPKSKQTGVVERSGVSSRAHYFPLGLKPTSRKQLHADFAAVGPGILSTTPRPVAAVLGVSPGASAQPRARGEESPHSIRSMGPTVGRRRNTTQDAANARELWGPGTPSRTLRMRRSVTEGDLQHSAALGDVLEDLRRGDGVAAEISGLPVLISGVQLELTPEDSASPGEGNQEEVGEPSSAEGRKRRTRMSGRRRCDFTPKTMGFTPTTMNFTPKTMGFTPKTMGFTPKTMGFTPKTMGFTPKTMGFTPTTMNFTFKTMGFTPKTMGFTPKTMNFRSVSTDEGTILSMCVDTNGDSEEDSTGFDTTRDGMVIAQAVRRTTT